MSKAQKEFWLSDEGILVRLEDLSHDFAFRVYNGALKGAFTEAGIRRLKWVTTVKFPIGVRTCKYCYGQNGRIYHTGMFLPRMPRHLLCECFWDALVELD